LGVGPTPADRREIEERFDEVAAETVIDDDDNNIFEDENTYREPVRLCLGVGPTPADIRLLLLLSYDADDAATVVLVGLLLRARSPSRVNPPKSSEGPLTLSRSLAEVAASSLSLIILPILLLRPLFSDARCGSGAKASKIEAKSVLVSAAGDDKVVVRFLIEFSSDNGTLPQGEAKLIDEPVAATIHSGIIVLCTTAAVVAVVVTGGSGEGDKSEDVSTGE
jgi:hypothetical protein